jgi:16S rRNA processing protein RimM
MKKNDCYYLGTITATYGFKGGLKIFLDVDNPLEYSELESLFVEIDKRLIPFFIKQIKLQSSKQKAVVFLEDIESIDEAQKLLKCDLYLPLYTLPKKEGKNFYFHEIIGFTIVDQTKGKLDKIKHVLDNLPQPVFQMFYKGKEVLIPIHDDIIVEVDRTRKEIHVALPEGLLEVYLNESSQ